MQLDCFIYNNIYNALCSMNGNYVEQCHVDSSLFNESLLKPLFAVGIGMRLISLVNTNAS